MSPNAFKVGHRHRWQQANQGVSPRDWYQTIEGKTHARYGCAGCGQIEWQPIEEHADDTFTLHITPPDGGPPVALEWLSAREITAIDAETECAFPDDCRSGGHEPPLCSHCGPRAYMRGLLAKFARQHGVPEGDIRGHVDALFAKVEQEREDSRD